MDSALLPDPRAMKTPDENILCILVCEDNVAYHMQTWIPVKGWSVKAHTGV